MQYKTIRERTIGILDGAVNHHLKNGWSLRGYLQVVISPGFMYHYQTMVKEEKTRYTFSTPEPEPVEPDTAEYK